MKFVSFNTNGIRARLHQLQALMNDQAPDVIGIQETKVHDEQFPQGEIEEMGLHVERFGQKGHYGVALLSKSKPTRVAKGFPGHGEEEQKRLILADYVSDEGKTITVINGYFPQGESRDHPQKFPNKQKFYGELLNLLQQDYQPEQNIIVMGDMNIAPLDLDIGIGADNMKRWLRSGKCSFLPEEREWYQRLMDWGLVDTFRHLYPDQDDLFSWFDYPSRGFERDPKRGLRIDMILASQPMLSSLDSAGIDYQIRGLEKPSDHCPIWADFKGL